MPNLLKRWIRPITHPRADHLVFTFYTRAGCGCCDRAYSVLREAQSRHRFTMETVDIDTDPSLVDRFGLSVPVVAVDGKIRFRGVVNPALLDRLLVAEARSQGR